uniref:Uncharacterized protein n=2 Tax=Aegilops tauschii subsp. strangulata TaxID=200361 RepID=A0A453LD13_AEGTS
GDFDGLFSVQIHHKGFFYGSESNKTNMDYEVDWFDMCESDTWSMLSGVYAKNAMHAPPRTGLCR